MTGHPRGIEYPSWPTCLSSTCTSHTDYSLLDGACEISQLIKVVAEQKMRAVAVKLNPIRMASALWRHGPRMRAIMKQKNIRWPEFRYQEMSDLLAYLGTLK